MQTTDSLIIVPLTCTTSNGKVPFGITPTTINKTDTIDYVFDGKGYTKKAFFYFSIQSDQSLFQKYKTGLINYEDFQSKFSIWKYDSTKLSKTPIRHAVVFFSGIKNGKKIIICDANQNKDFTDDKVFEYDLSLRDKKFKIDSLETIFTSAEYFTDNKIIRKNITLKILPFDNAYNFRDKDESDLMVFTGVYQHQLGFFDLNGKSYKVVIGNPFFPLSNYTIGSYLYVGEKAGNFIAFNPRLRLFDKFRLGNVFLQAKYVSLFGDTLIFRKTEEQASDKYGYRKGDIMPEFQLPDVNGNSIYSLANDKTIKFIDFWGTWCKPCIEKIDSIKLLKDEFGAKISFISIAYDDDNAEVKKMINKKQMDWLNLLAARSNSEVTDILDVNCFPTYFIVDKDNQIKYRTCGATISDVRKELLSAVSD